MEPTQTSAFAGQKFILTWVVNLQLEDSACLRPIRDVLQLVIMSHALLEDVTMSPNVRVLLGGTSGR